MVRLFRFLLGFACLALSAPIMAADSNISDLERNALAAFQPAGRLLRPVYHPVYLCMRLKCAIMPCYLIVCRHSPAQNQLPLPAYV